MADGLDITAEYWYPVRSHPGAGGLPWFAVDHDGLVRRFRGHPMGESPIPSFHIVDGTAYTTGTDETKFCAPGIPWFSVAGSMVCRGEGHPDGASPVVMYEQRVGSFSARGPAKSEVNTTSEEDVLVACVEFADTSAAAYDVVEGAQRLANRCVALVTGSAVGVMLADRDGGLSCVASSSEDVRRVEHFELELEEGPSFDAFRTGTPMYGKMSASDHADGEWPRFATRAREAGFASISVFPMRLRAETIGALSLFCVTPGPLGPRDQMVAQALADIATIGILQQRALSDGRNIVCQLETALGSRVVIEQAKGILTERLGVSIDMAFTLLRGYARAHNSRLREIARGVVSGTLSADAITQIRVDVRGRA